MTRSIWNANIRGHLWWILDTASRFVNKVILKEKTLYFPIRYGGKEWPVFQKSHFVLYKCSSCVHCTQYFRVLNWVCQKKCTTRSMAEWKKRLSYKYCRLSAGNSVLIAMLFSICLLSPQSFVMSFNNTFDILSSIIPNISHVHINVSMFLLCTLLGQ